MREGEVGKHDDVLDIEKSARDGDDGDDEEENDEDESPSAESE